MAFDSFSALESSAPAMFRLAGLLAGAFGLSDVTSVIPSCSEMGTSYLSAPRSEGQAFSEPRFRWISMDFP